MAAAQALLELGTYPSTLAISRKVRCSEPAYSKPNFTVEQLFSLYQSPKTKTFFPPTFLDEKKKIKEENVARSLCDQFSTNRDHGKVYNRSGGTGRKTNEKRSNNNSDSFLSSKSTLVPLTEKPDSQPTLVMKPFVNIAGAKLAGTEERENSSQLVGSSLKRKAVQSPPPLDLSVKRPCRREDEDAGEKNKPNRCSEIISSVNGENYISEKLNKRISTNSSSPHRHSPNLIRNNSILDFYNNSKQAKLATTTPTMDASRQTRLNNKTADCVFSKFKVDKKGNCEKDKLKFFYPPDLLPSSSDNLLEKKTFCSSSYSNTNLNFQNQTNARGVHLQKLLSEMHNYRKQDTVSTRGVGGSYPCQLPLQVVPSINSQTNGENSSHENVFFSPTFSPPKRLRSSSTNSEEKRFSFPNYSPSKSKSSSSTHLKLLLSIVGNSVSTASCHDDKEEISRTEHNGKTTSSGSRSSFHRPSRPSSYGKLSPSLKFSTIFSNLGDWSCLEMGQYPAFGRPPQTPKHRKTVSFHSLRKDVTPSNGEISETTKRLLENVKTFHKNKVSKQVIQPAHVASTSGLDHTCPGCQPRPSKSNSMIAELWRYKKIDRYTTSSQSPVSNVVYCSQLKPHSSHRATPQNSASESTSSWRKSLSISELIRKPSPSIFSRVSRSLQLSDIISSELRRFDWTKQGQEVNGTSDDVNDEGDLDLLANNIEESSDEEDEPITCRPSSHTNLILTTTRIPSMPNHTATSPLGPAKLAQDDIKLTLSRQNIMQQLIHSRSRRESGKTAYMKEDDEKDVRISDLEISDAEDEERTI